MIGITLTEATPAAGAAGNVLTTSDSELQPLGPMSLIACRQVVFQLALE